MRKLLSTLVLLLLSLSLFAQRGLYKPIDLNRVHWSVDDFGMMYTFDDVPSAKIKAKFGFEPTQKWLDEVRLSAVQFGGGCSGSFVSEDGLIMTNHHCVRGRLKDIEKQGENIYRDGFYAKTLSEERRFPGLYVDQLLEIKDVSQDVFDAMKNGKDEQEKASLRDNKIKELEEKYSKPKKNIVAKVVTLYNGGKYSLYIYKRYDDIRLVMVPDVQIAATGWDWDNFTYPRYELDFAFVRAYENGKPVKVKHYFRWSEKGAQDGETVFVVGRPGNTDRLFSISQLEFMRDYRHPVILNYYNERYNAQYKYFINHPERHARELSTLLSIANGRKYYAGIYKALRDPYIMAKKKDFEKDLRAKVKADPQLNKEYGQIWDEIDKVISDKKEYEKDYLFAVLLSRMPSSVWQTAFKLYDYAEHPQKYPKFEDVYVKVDDPEREQYNVQAIADFMYDVRGDDCSLLQNLFRKDKDAYKSLLKVTELDNEDFVRELYNAGAAGILDSDDPLLIAIATINKTLEKYSGKYNEDRNKLDILNQQLGYLIYKTYGTDIPPDATLTLRFQPGRIKGYEYNGTLAPGKTTYYGLYDRYYSFGQKDYPWGLHPRWQKVPKGLDLSTFIGFASTNDIVGGNSGSAVINRNREIVGLIHDGNLESLAGAYIFLEDDNRAVATDSDGLIKALQYVYKTPELISELRTGRRK